MIAHITCSRSHLLRHAVAGTLVAVLASACGGSSVPVPRRMVADPITLPEGMEQLKYSVDIPTDTDTISLPVWDHGISDRLMLTSFTWLSYALVEELDRETGEGRAPVALAVHGGLLGVGFSSVRNFFVVPGTGVTAIVRRERLRVRARLSIASVLSLHAAMLRTTTGIDGMIEIMDGVALELSASAEYAPKVNLFDAASTSWYMLRTGLGLRVAVRPRPWVSLYVGGRAERLTWWREPPEDPLPPDAPQLRPSRVQRSYPVWLGAMLHW